MMKRFRWRLQQRFQRPLHWRLGVAAWALCASLAACGGMPQGAQLAGADAGADAALAETAAFVDMAAYLLKTQQSTERLGALERTLRDAFDDICMDTFCEGDYGNLTPLSWRCSVAAHTGAVQQCIWVFAGSAEFIDAATGNIDVEDKISTCAIPVQGSADELLDTLLAEDDGVPVLERSLPGGATTVYRSLSSCL
jgi:hypothetical protein